MSVIETLGTKLPKEIERIRNEILPAYKSIGIPGQFAVNLIEQDLKLADKAIIENDVIKMIAIYKKLKEWES